MKINRKEYKKTQRYNKYNELLLILVELEERIKEIEKNETIKNE